MKSTFFFLIALSLCSCGEDVTTTIITPGATVGNIRGRVRLYDSVEFNGAFDPLPDASGVTVELEGSPYSTTTDRNGEWLLKDIPTGIYKSLKVSKDGFSYGKSPDFEFIGNGTLTHGVTSLYRGSLLSVKLTLGPFEELKHIIRSDTIIEFDNGTKFRGYKYDTVLYPQGKAIFYAQTVDDLSSTSYDCYSAFYISKTPTIDPTDASTFQFTSYLLQHNPGTGGLPYPFTIFDLLRVGFQHGDVVYCVVYTGRPYVTSTHYYDRYYQQTLITGFSPNHSEVKSFIVP